ncbi:MAG: hypothetical protein JXR63_03490 [Spirochaetales bacterium]|nr:hypothetical protein [Spirochaetales bacterium]
MKYYKNHLTRAFNTSAVILAISFSIVFFSGIIYLSWLVATSNVKLFNILFISILSVAVVFLTISYIIKNHKRKRLTFAILNIINSAFTIGIIILGVFLLPTVYKVLGFVIIFVALIMYIVVKLLIKKKLNANGKN